MLPPRVVCLVSDSVISLSLFLCLLSLLKWNKICLSVIPIGAYSLGSAIQVKQWTKSKGLLSQMTTYCRSTAYFGSGKCNSWSVNDAGYLESGDNKANNSIRSTLDFRVEIEEDVGNLTFEYMVSAEEYFDYFGVMIDGALVFKKSNTDPVDEWSVQSLNVTKGYHIITFFYSKDFTVTAGYDMARIRMIELTGLSEVPVNCTACDPGYYSDGTHPCMPCAPGTYTDQPGQSVCKLCPAGQSSFEGSSMCYALSVPCTTMDYFSYYQPCNQNGQTTLTYAWIQPQICNSSDPASATLPDPVPGINCASLPQPQCNPGQEYSTSTYDCVYCKPGTYSQNGESCSPCATGTASEQKVITLQKFITRDNQLTQSLLKTNCRGECSSNGWRFTDSFADSGIGNGVSQSWISINLTNLNIEKIDLDYGLTCDAGSGSFDIEVDGTLIGSIPCSGCSNFTNGYQTVEVNLRGAQVVRFIYNTMTLMSNDAYYCDRAIISKITLHSFASMYGGSPSCKSCIAGQFSENGANCSSCPAGYKSDNLATTCNACTAGTFSYKGSAQCYNCGNGMTSGDAATKCEWQYGTCHFNGTFINASKEYAFEQFGQAISSIVATSAAEPTSKFYFNLCSNQVVGRRMRKIKQSNDANPCAAGGSYLCKITEQGDFVSLGKSVDIQTGIYGSTFQDAGFYLKYIDLSEQACFNNLTSKYENYQAIVSVRCSPEAIEEFSGPTITMSTPCLYIMQFSSKYGCPLCSDTDYDALEGQCNATTLTKQIVYVRKSGVEHLCYGGVEKPPQTVRCSVNVITAPYWIVGAILGAAGLIILTLGAATLFFYYKFRDASQKFHRLNEEGNNEATGREVELNE
jgi:hypothetical protein